MQSSVCTSRYCNSPTNILCFETSPNHAKFQSVTQMLQATKILRVILPCLLVRSYRNCSDFILRAINPGQVARAWTMYQSLKSEVSEDESSIRQKFCAVRYCSTYSLRFSHVTIFTRNNFFGIASNKYSFLIIKFIFVTIISTYFQSDFIFLFLSFNHKYFVFVRRT